VRTAPRTPAADGVLPSIRATAIGVWLTPVRQLAAPLVPGWAVPDGGPALATPASSTAREKAKAIISNGRGVTPGPPRVSAARSNANPDPGVAGGNPRGRLPSLSEAGGRPSVRLPSACCASAEPKSAICRYPMYTTLGASSAIPCAGGRRRPGAGLVMSGIDRGTDAPDVARTRRGPKARPRPQGGALSSPTPPPAGSARWRTGSPSTRCSRGRRPTRAPAATATPAPRTAPRRGGRTWPKGTPAGTRAPPRSAGPR
jgi:hypothetical protein